MINELLSGVPLTMYMCDNRTLDETHTVSVVLSYMHIYVYIYIYIYQKPDFCMYVCLFYMVIYVSRLGGCVRRSFYSDILFPHSLPYRDILIVYPKENCALFALLAFFPKQRKCQVSCHVSQSMRLISQIIYLNQIIIIFILIDRNQSSSSSCPI
jgi:hypothetical protein